jgi:tRNA (guanine-N7-)-methyltransferase
MPYGLEREVGFSLKKELPSCHVERICPSGWDRDISCCLIARDSSTSLGITNRGRSFRQSGMRSGQKVELAFATEYVPEDYFQTLNLESVFSRRVPLEVDLGCGDGSLLVALAKQNPQRNFLGFERLLGRVRTACRKLSRENLENARVIRIESSYAVACLLPPNSVSVFYLLFPDPWPKRRHQRRRVVTDEFLEAIHRALVPGGSFVTATDMREYFQEIRRRAGETGTFAEQPIGDCNPPTTTFEKHFRERGLEIYRLVLRKVSPVR